MSWGDWHQNTSGEYSRLVLELPIVIQTGDNTQVDLYPKPLIVNCSITTLEVFKSVHSNYTTQFSVTHLVLSIVNTRATEINSHKIHAWNSYILHPRVWSLEWAQLLKVNGHITVLDSCCFIFMKFILHLVNPERLPQTLAVVRLAGTWELVLPGHTQGPRRLSVSMTDFRFEKTLPLGVSAAEIGGPALACWTSSWARAPSSAAPVCPRSQRASEKLAQVWRAPDTDLEAEETRKETDQWCECTDLRSSRWPELPIFLQCWVL